MPLNSFTRVTVRSMNTKMDISILSILTVSRHYHHEGMNHMSKKFDEPELESGDLTMERTKVVNFCCDLLI